MPVSAEGHQEATALTGSGVIERWFLDLSWSRYLAWCLNNGKTPDEWFRDNAAAREQAQVWTDQVVTALSDAGYDIVKRPHGPVSPPVDGPARTVEVSDRTGRTDPDVP